MASIFTMWIKILLPKATEPQAYDVKVALKGGNELSNSIVVHYVLQGVSATIQNLSLDKDYYKIGETAIMTFSFTPSADSYPGSRQDQETKVSDTTLTASLKDGRGNDCAEQIEKVYGSDYSGSQTELQVGIKSTCKDPAVTFSLTDQAGKVLDEKSIATETQSEDKSPETALIIFGIVIFFFKYFIICWIIQVGPAHPYLRPSRGHRAGNYLKIRFYNFRSAGFLRLSQICSITTLSSIIE